MMKTKGVPEGSDDDVGEADDADLNNTGNDMEGGEEEDEETMEGKRAIGYQVLCVVPKEEISCIFDDIQDNFFVISS